MSQTILKMLGLGAQEESSDRGATETVRRIVAELEALKPDKARYIAAFAYILGRVAHADRHFSDQETRKMEQIVSQLGHIPEELAVLVVEIAKSQNRLFGGTENFLVTREFSEISSPEQRQELLDCLFAISAADDSISSAEETQIRQISSELGFSHKEYVAARSVYAQHRAVLKPLRDRD